MDNSIVVALIAGTATIVSAFITAVTGSGAPGGAHVRLRSWKFGVVTLALALGLAIAAVIANHYFVIERAETFARNQLLPGARYSYINSFTDGEVQAQRRAFNLSRYPVYGPGQSRGQRDEVLKGTEVLTFKSSPMNANSYMVGTFYAAEPTGIAGKGLRLILLVDHDDKIELGLTDQYNHDPKRSLDVYSGWAEYDIPYEQFPAVDRTGITQFHVGFSSSAGSAPAYNRMEIALISWYD